MSDDALEHFLHGSHGGFFLGAHAVAKPKNQERDAAKYPKRQPEAKDAVALIPLLHGMFKLNKTNVLPIQRPLIGLQLPKTNKAGWNLRVNKAVAVVVKHMKELKINFYDSIRRHADGKVPLAEVLGEVDRIDEQLLKSLVLLKESLIANAVDVRVEILKAVFERIKTSNVVEGLPPAAALGGDEPAERTTQPTELSVKLASRLQQEWCKGLQDLRNLPLVFTESFNTQEKWSGLAGDDAQQFWTSRMETPTLYAQYGERARAQETYQVDAMIASIRLQQLYYKKLIAVLNDNGFESNLFNTINKSQRNMSEEDAVKLVLGTDEEKEWKERANSFFQNVLVERFEILQSNIYSFLTAYAGRGKAAQEQAQSTMLMAVRSTVWPLFESTSQVQINSTDTQAEEDDKRIRITSREKGVSFRPYVDKIIAFFKDTVPAGTETVSLKPSDKLEIRNYVNEAFTSLPVTLKHSDLPNLTIPSIARMLDSNQGNKFLKLPELKGKHAPNLPVSLQFTERKGAQHFRAALDSLIKIPNLAFSVTARIVHAVGLADSAFTASYVAKTGVADATYKSLFPKLLSVGSDVGTIGQVSQTQTLLSRPAWMDAVINDVPKAGSPGGALNIITALAPAAPGVEELFVFKTGSGAALTRSKQPKKKKAKKPAAKKQEGGKKTDKKNSPHKKGGKEEPKKKKDTKQNKKPKKP